MFGFIRTACTAIKESFTRACAATKNACKSVYTKIRNFFFGTPVETVIEPINGRNYGALSNFIDPLVIQRPHKPTEPPRVLPVITNKNDGIPAPFSSQTGRFKRDVPGPFSLDAMRLSARHISVFPKTTVSENPVVNSTITSAKTVSEPRKPFIPVVSSKDFLDDAALNRIREKSPEGFAANPPKSPVPLQISEPAPVTVAAAPQAEERITLGGAGAIIATVELCDNLGSILDQAIKDGKPQEAFNSAVESVSGLFWGALGTTPTHNKPKPAEGWGADEPNKPRNRSLFT